MHYLNESVMNVIEKFSTFYTDLASMQVNELETIYSSNVRFIDPVAKHEGIEAVKGYFARLLSSAKCCMFIIHNKQQTVEGDYCINWTMVFSSSKMNKGKQISVDGISYLKLTDNKISYQRDYYDLGQMLYENVPLLGRIIKKIKEGLS
jgi:hypothetical protein